MATVFGGVLTIAISAAAVGLVLLFSIVLPALYNVFLHPLRKIPGPPSWIIFPLLRHWAAITGTLDEQSRRFHEKYGDVVRTHPNELSFTTTAAWKDIYGPLANLPKVMVYDEEARNVFNAEHPEVHGRMRRVLNPIFSERGARSLEPTVKLYADKLFDSLANFAREGRFVDLSMYWNMTTFDIIGRLAFGEDFDGLKNQRIHPWVKNIFDTFKILPLIIAISEYPFLMWLLKSCMPRSVAESREKHVAQSHDKARRRMQNESLKDNGDFMDTMLQARGTKDEFSEGEIMANANILIIAGSETSATALSGLVYWLMRTPKVLQEVTEEVRQAFEREDQITMASTAQQVPYMLACIQEGLRIYPPGAGSIQRFVPRTESRTVDGVVIPGGTRLGVHHSAAYTSARHFHRPKEFIPERWLPAASTPDSPYYSDNRAMVQPFSVGPRNCIGQTFARNEMRYLLARLLFRFDLVQLAPECREWHQQRSFVIWEKGPLRVLLREREWQ
ncbi:cytochrome P450 [Lecanosticta acicola]|uniref:Cytochrome P450 n=1 Tax=Lecanosticta acicola TaxID=111012 RepID=A0AAI8Z828_9PEZI|nr:cytochrome P450 [Lecanosticta acicola]